MEIRKIELACASVFRRMENYGTCFLQANIVKEILEENMGYKPDLIYGYASDRDGTYIRHFWLELDGNIIDPSTLSLPHKPIRKLSKSPLNGKCLTSSTFQSIQQNSFNMAKNNHFWQDMENHCGVEEVQKYKFIKQQLANGDI
jgi:hypothetical protein